MKKRLLWPLIWLLCVSGALATTVPLLTGPQPAADLVDILNTLIKRFNAALAADACSEPIAYTPTLFGLTTPGAPTYSLQSGKYSRCNKTIVYNFAVVTSNLGGAVGALILALPVTVAAGFSGDCFLSAYEGWTAPAGYTALAVSAAQGSTLGALSRSGSGQANALLDVSEWAAATTLRGTCVYQAAS